MQTTEKNEIIRSFSVIKRTRCVTINFELQKENLAKISLTLFWATHFRVRSPNSSQLIYAHNFHFKSHLVSLSLWSVATVDRTDEKINRKTITIVVNGICFYLFRKCCFRRKKKRIKRHEKS